MASAETGGVVPHETVTPGPWRLYPRPRSGNRLRVAVLGVLANHKGAQVVASVAMAADPAKLEIQVIGDVEAEFSRRRAEPDDDPRRYHEGELPALLAKYRPHVVWFPASWPETYSFTLSAAIEAGLPIVASEIGAFPERLAGRPLTWLIPPTLDPEAWLTLFESVAVAIRSSAIRESHRPGLRPCTPASATWKAPGAAYRTPDVAPRWPAWICAAMASPRWLSFPETFEDGSSTPCAHIRLLRPLDHPGCGRWAVGHAGRRRRRVSRYRADVIVTQRHAVPSIAAAEALAAHAKRTGATLIFDLDDDLLTIPPDHPGSRGTGGRAPRWWNA